MFAGFTSRMIALFAHSYTVNSLLGFLDRLQLQQSWGAFIAGLSFPILAGCQWKHTKFLIHSESLVYPFIVISKTQQLETQEKESMFSCAKKIYERDGFKGFYGGFGLTVVRGVGNISL